jgi:hypothetical protein
MPPAKKVVPPEDSRSDASTVRERQIAAAAHARKSKQNAAAAAASARDSGSLALKELAAVSAETGGREGPGVSWSVLRAHCAHAWYAQWITDRRTDVVEHESFVAAQHIPGVASPVDACCFHIAAQSGAVGQPWDWEAVAYNGEAERQETCEQGSAGDECAQALQWRCCE